MPIFPSVDLTYNFWKAVLHPEPDGYFREWSARLESDPKGAAEDRRATREPFFALDDTELALVADTAQRKLYCEEEYLTSPLRWAVHLHNITVNSSLYAKVRYATEAIGANKTGSLVPSWSLGLLQGLRVGSDHLKVTATGRWVVDAAGGSGDVARDWDIVMGTFAGLARGEDEELMPAARHRREAALIVAYLERLTRSVHDYPASAFPYTSRMGEKGHMRVMVAYLLLAMAAAKMDLAKVGKTRLPKDDPPYLPPQADDVKVEHFEKGTVRVRKIRVCKECRVEHEGGYQLIKVPEAVAAKMRASPRPVLAVEKVEGCIGCDEDLLGLEHRDQDEIRTVALCGGCGGFHDRGTVPTAGVVLDEDLGPRAMAEVVECLWRCVRCSDDVSAGDGRPVFPIGVGLHRPGAFRMLLTDGDDLQGSGGYARDKCLVAVRRWDSCLTCRMARPRLWSRNHDTGETGVLADPTGALAALADPPVGRGGLGLAAVEALAGCDRCVARQRLAASRWRPGGTEGWRKVRPEDTDSSAASFHTCAVAPNCCSCFKTMRVETWDSFTPVVKSVEEEWAAFMEELSTPSPEPLLRGPSPADAADQRSFRTVRSSSPTPSASPEMAATPGLTYEDIRSSPPPPKPDDAMLFTGFGLEEKNWESRFVTSKSIK